MVLTEINSDQFRDMVRAATHRMGKNAEFVNKLNVFPVPDGDTGTNMNLTHNNIYINDYLIIISFNYYTASIILAI